MSWMKWLPWRFIVRYVARKHDFLDPISLLARLHSFAQPSEVGEPIELLRAGVVFHARGLINSRVIQHNLDWVWPYWIERQFDPTDPSFIPRAFSITHINLSHRNWTAIGHPDCDELPIVDPRGLLTPFFDSWSLDGWLLSSNGRCLLPSRAPEARQRQVLHDDGVRIVTESAQDGLALTTTCWVELEGGVPVCKMRLDAHAEVDASLVLSLRPSNPEGISFIHEAHLSDDGHSWTVDGKHRVDFSEPAQRHYVSDYHNGDVHIHLMDRQEQTRAVCDVGMVTTAALFPVEGGRITSITARIPLARKAPTPALPDSWANELSGTARLQCPDSRYQFLYDAAVASLVLHSPDDVYPGPFTYKRFWFRDAAFIINALLNIGLTQRAERALSRFPERQTTLGYFRSQEGEWDSNGEALWIMRRFLEVTGRPLPRNWVGPVKRGARWIVRKRLKDTLEAPHAGLLPAGFSAEHLGPNDYYYWDDFWGIAGLEAACSLLRHEAPDDSADFRREADNFARAVDRSLEKCQRRLGRLAMPASPYRRLDAGAIGSLALGYPTQLCAPDDPRLLDGADFLIERCFVKGAFNQDMIHSGLNAYLTLHVAQVLLRAGDPRHVELMDAVAELASPTGQWPEAIHPATLGGCMGDGHHVWASAEWVLMIRNCFVREEDDVLVLCAGIPERWLDQDQPIRFGPAPTAFGPISLCIRPAADGAHRVEWQADWFSEAPTLDLQLPGCEATIVPDGDSAVTLRPLYA
ncbi:hypothetical protein [Marinobacter bohaiensis]|uniref:hypothetical protein n=1 Tax=Marinobacter bohaiensis TaxID=2201898 RepID=UPI000DAD9818|nr:hypothetical protein [Marinobacter bohaiensis]